MKKNKRCILLISVVMAMLLFSFSALAETLVLPRWSYFISIAGDIDIADNGKAEVFVDITANPTKVDEIKATCRLQRLENSGWKTIKTWTETSDDVDPASIMMLKTYYVEKGYSYRIQLNTKAYVDGSVKENLTNEFDYGYFN